MTGIGTDANFLTANASEEKKKEIRDALDFIEKFPTIAAVKFQMGISF